MNATAPLGASGNTANAGGVEIRFSSRADIEPLMAFIDRHWAAGHVLAKSHELLQWQHGGTDGRDCDYIVAARGDDILGVLGFIVTSRYDPMLSGSRTLWLALWKVREDAPSGLGIRMLAFLENRVSHEIIGCVGIRGEVVRLYRALGYTVGRMNRYYVLHPARTDFVLARVPVGMQRNGRTPQCHPPTLKRLSARALLERQPFIDRAWPREVVPRKSARYFAKRFLECPFYEYHVHAIEHDGSTQGLLVTRTCEVGESRTLRIVDGFLPPSALPGLGIALQRRLAGLDAECADLYAVGLDAAALEASALLMLAQDEENIIIPNYYEPFERRNVDLMWAYKVKPGQVIVSFKADADQDRPNRVS